MNEELMQKIEDEMLAEELGIKVEEVFEIMKYYDFDFDAFVNIVRSNSIRFFDTEKELVYWLYDEDVDRHRLVDIIWDMYANNSDPYDKDNVFKLENGKMVFVFYV